MSSLFDLFLLGHERGSWKETFRRKIRSCPKTVDYFRSAAKPGVCRVKGRVQWTWTNTQNHWLFISSQRDLLSPSASDIFELGKKVLMSCKIANVIQSHVYLPVGEKGQHLRCTSRWRLFWELSGWLWTCGHYTTYCFNGKRAFLLPSSWTLSMFGLRYPVT